MLPPPHPAHFEVWLRAYQCGQGRRHRMGHGVVTDVQLHKVVACGGTQQAKPVGTGVRVLV